MWYVLVASAFAFIAVSLYNMGISRGYLYKLYTPLELQFLAFLLLVDIDDSKEWKVSVSILAVLLAVFCALMGVGNADNNESFAAHIILLIFSFIALVHKPKIWKTYLIFGTMGYCLINLNTYPSYHWLANTFMNLFHTVALVRK